MACTRSLPHIVADGCSEPHTAGRRGSPNRRQRSASSSCTQGTPGGLPWGMPGMGVEIDGAVQQAPQPGRQDGGVAIAEADVDMRRLSADENAAGL